MSIQSHQIQSRGPRVRHDGQKVKEIYGDEYTVQYVSVEQGRIFTERQSRIVEDPCNRYHGINKSGALKKHRAFDLPF